MAAKKICFDRILPRDLALPHRSLSQGPLRPSRAISPRNKQWPNGAISGRYVRCSNARSMIGAMLDVGARMTNHQPPRNPAAGGGHER